MHGTRKSKVSEYGLALLEKKKIKRFHGLHERQLGRIFAIASKSPKHTGAVLLVLCERRHPARADLHFRFALAARGAGANPQTLLEPLNEAALLAPYKPSCRIDLADMWFQLGSSCDAAESLADVDPSKVICKGCLRRMALMFHDVGDIQSAETCEARRAALSSSSRCPNQD